MNRRVDCDYGVRFDTNTVSREYRARLQRASGL
jgi:hypothetical protein